MSCRTLYLATDNAFIVEGVRNSVSNEFINDATVELTLLDATGNELSGQTWPLELDYVAGSNGNYSGDILDSVVALDGDTGTARVVIASGSLNTTIDFDVSWATRRAASLAWTSPEELYNLFGRTNVNRWADLENEDNASDIQARLLWAIDEATADARLRLNTAMFAEDPSCIPRPLRMATTRLAGVALYESRGVKDTTSEDGEHRLTYHKKQADLFFQKVVAGQLVLDNTGSAFPAVIDSLTGGINTGSTSVNPCGTICCDPFSL